MASRYGILPAEKYWLEHRVMSDMRLFHKESLEYTSFVTKHRENLESDIKKSDGNISQQRPVDDARRSEVQTLRNLKIGKEYLDCHFAQCKRFQNLVHALYKDLISLEKSKCFSKEPVKSEVNTEYVRLTQIFGKLHYEFSKFENLEKKNLKHAIEDLMVKYEFSLELKDNIVAVTKMAQMFQHEFRRHIIKWCVKVEKRNVEKAEVEYVHDLVLKFSTIIQKSNKCLRTVLRSPAVVEHSNVAKRTGKVSKLDDEADECLEIFERRLSDIEDIPKLIERDLSALRLKLGLGAMHELQEWIQQKKEPIVNEFNEFFSALEEVIDKIDVTENEYHHQDAMNAMCEKRDDLLTIFKNLGNPNSALSGSNTVPREILWHSMESVATSLVSDLEIYHEYIVKRFEDAKTIDKVEHKANPLRSWNDVPVSSHISSQFNILTIVNTGVLLCLRKLDRLPSFDSKAKSGIEPVLKCSDMIQLQSHLHEYIASISDWKPGEQRAQNVANLESEMIRLDSTAARLVTFTLRLQLLTFAASSQELWSSPDPYQALAEWFHELEIGDKDQQLKIPGEIIEAANTARPASEIASIPVFEQTRKIVRSSFGLAQLLAHHDLIFTEVLKVSPVDLAVSTSNDTDNMNLLKSSALERYARETKALRSRLKVLLSLVFVIEQNSIIQEVESLKVALGDYELRQASSFVEDLRTTLPEATWSSKNPSDFVGPDTINKYKANMNNLNQQLMKFQNSLVRYMLQRGGLPDLSVEVKEARSRDPSPVPLETKGDASMASHDTDSSWSKFLRALKSESRHLHTKLYNHEQVLVEIIALLRDDIRKLAGEIPKDRKNARQLGIHDLNDPESIVERVDYDLKQCTKLKHLTTLFVGGLESLLEDNRLKIKSVNSDIQNKHQDLRKLFEELLKSLDRVPGPNTITIHKEARETLMFHIELQQQVKNTFEEINNMAGMIQEESKRLMYCWSMELQKDVTEDADIEHVKELVMKFGTFVQISSDYLESFWARLQNLERPEIRLGAYHLPEYEYDWFYNITPRFGDLQFLLGLIEKELSILGLRLPPKRLNDLQDWIEKIKPAIPASLDRISSSLTRVEESPCGAVDQEEIGPAIEVMKKVGKALKVRLKNLRCPESAVPKAANVAEPSSKEIAVFIASELATCRSLIGQFIRGAASGNFLHAANPQARVSLQDRVEIEDVASFSPIRSQCEILTVANIALIACLSEPSELLIINGKARKLLEWELERLDLSRLLSELRHHVGKFSESNVQGVTNLMEFLNLTAAKVVTSTIRLQLLNFLASWNSVLDDSDSPMALSGRFRSLDIDNDDQRLRIPDSIERAVVQDRNLHIPKPIAEHLLPIMRALFDLESTLDAQAYKRSRVTQTNASVEVVLRTNPVHLETAEGSAQSEQDFDLHTKQVNRRMKILFIIIFMISSKPFVKGNKELLNALEQCSKHEEELYTVLDSTPGPHYYRSPNVTKRYSEILLECENLLVDCIINKGGLIGTSFDEYLHVANEQRPKTTLVVRSKRKAPDGKVPDGKASDGKASDGKASDGKASDGKAATASKRAKH